MPVPNDDTARRAAAARAAEEVTPGMTLGLGSGRAVWAVIAALRDRFGDDIPVRASVASERTRAVALEHGIEVVDLDGVPGAVDLLFDGADEVAPGLDLLKGGGGALLREKLVVLASARFVCVAETPKRVARLGEQRRLPVEVVPFAWERTRERVAHVVDDPRLRQADDGSGKPYVTDEGHYILDCRMPPDRPAHEVGDALKAMTGVVEHGLFLGLAEKAILGRPDGTVEIDTGG